VKGVLEDRTSAPGVTALAKNAVAPQPVIQRMDSATLTTKDALPAVDSGPQGFI